MTRRVSWAWMAAGALGVFLVAPAGFSQAAAPGSSPAQKQTGQKSQPDQNANPQNGNTQKPAQNDGNPFPEDENTVPVMPSGNVPDYSAHMNGDAHAAAPAVDKDPVRSPEDEAPGGDDSMQGFSSSQSGMANLAAPPPDEDQGKRRKNEDDSLTQPLPRETPKEDVDVGNYYMDNKDWRGALSRFQSALVLAPDNPDVYWGLAECERHLGQFAQARANYLKVMEYDPGSHHAKEARKALEDPQVANAKK